MVSVTMKQMLEAGVHFGHQTKRWNPKMKEYIFGQRNGIYIIDLQKSLKLFKQAIQFVYELGAQGKTVLFLGTKRQAQEVIQEAANRTELYYVNQRWLGGLLTNFVTIQKSIKRFRELETMRSTGQYDLFSKKEVARYERERKKLEKNLSGIKDMGALPDALFVIDTNMESIAIREAAKLGIPIIGVADTNCDPDPIDYIIPGNDDALRAIRLITETVAEAYLEGKAVFAARQKEIAEQAEKQRQAQAQQAAAARAAAHAAEGGETAGAEDASSAARPKTTVRRTLQRKPRVKKSETAATETAEAVSADAAVPAATAPTEDTAAPAEVPTVPSEAAPAEVPAAPADEPVLAAAEEPAPAAEPGRSE
ncbi:MAG: 30S ribosomal protein S2 [Acidobacteria bacterium]|nr:30S ribosomal protein S2 [Acidobacteriota bacterium]